MLNHLLLRGDEHVVVDMEAGIEHLGRGTAEGVDRMLIVVEPGWASVDTAKRIALLARDLGLSRVGVVANKIATDEDAAFVREKLDDLPLIGTLRHDSGVELHARSGEWARDGVFYRDMMALAERLG